MTTTIKPTATRTTAKYDKHDEYDDERDKDDDYHEEDNEYVFPRLRGRGWN